MDLKLQLRVSYHTAWTLKHNLTAAMRERHDIKPLHGIAELDDAHLGRKASKGKCGRGTQRKTPSATAQVGADGRPKGLQLGPPTEFSRRTVEAWMQQHLEPRTVVHSDRLACFLGWQRQQTLVKGGRKDSCETTGLSWVNTLLGNLKQAMDSTDHACKTRYPGRHLAAEFAYRLNRRYKVVDPAPRLPYVTVRTPPLRRRILTLAWKCWVRNPVLSREA